MDTNRKYWIRKDREQYFLNGVIAACIIAAFVSSYWHFSDRLDVKRSIRLNNKRITKKQEFQKLREPGYFSPPISSGATKYYKMEEEIPLPAIPDPAKENNGN